jgi:hypothetical protein
LVQRGQDAEKIDPDIDPNAAGEIILSTYLGLYLQKPIIPDLDVERYKAVVMALLHGNFKKDDV